MRPACRLAGSKGMDSLLAGVQSKTRLSCALAMAARAQMSSAIKTERRFISKVFAVSRGRHSEFQGRGLPKYLGEVGPCWSTAQMRQRFSPRSAQVSNYRRVRAGGNGMLFRA